MTDRLRTIHVRANDEDGRPTPVRIRFVGSDGREFLPYGRAKAADERAGGLFAGGTLQTGSRTYSYIDGNCEIGLPADRITVEIAKGPEYVPLQAEADLRSGKIGLRFTLTRWTSLRQEGWLSGDTEVFLLSPHDALIEGAAEDVAVVNLLIAEPGFDQDIDAAGMRCQPQEASAFPVANVLAFSGQRALLSRDGHMVAVNTHHFDPALGHLTLLNCHRIVFPLSTGRQNAETWTLGDWCDQCHRKGGLVIWDVPSNGGEPPTYGEALAEMVVEKIDALGVRDFCSPEVLDLWYRCLDAGFKVSLAGGSGKRNAQRAIGSMRTYAQSQPSSESSFQAWIEAIRSGRSFVTRGPIIRFAVNDEPAGSIIEQAGQQPVVVKAEATSVSPFDRLELIGDCAVLASEVAAKDLQIHRATIEVEVKNHVPGWLAARCISRHETCEPVNGEEIVAHTSPVFIRSLRSRAQAQAAVEFLLRCIDQDDLAIEGTQPSGCAQRTEKLHGVFAEARRLLSAKLTGLPP